VASPREGPHQQHQQQHGQQQPRQQQGWHHQQLADEQPDMESTSVLIGSRRPAAQAAGAAGPSPVSEQVHGGSAVPSPLVQPRPAAAAAAAAGSAVTPRRRLATLESPEAGLCLREDAHGKHRQPASQTQLRE
jgi:hypothetical protein